MKKISNFKRINRTISETKLTETILPDDGERPTASQYIYGQTKFTERQENFYQNLLRIYLITGSKEIPVYFSDSEGNNWRLDRGCIAMAVHDGFLAELKDSMSGFLETVILNW